MTFKILQVLGANKQLFYTCPILTKSGDKEMRFGDKGAVAIS